MAINFSMSDISGSPFFDFLFQFVAASDSGFGKPCIT
jgi:hypothetical protein